MYTPVARLRAPCSGGARDIFKTCSERGEEVLKLNECHLFVKQFGYDKIFFLTDDVCLVLPETKEG
jgi:hypothetical protein